MILAPLHTTPPKPALAGDGRTDWNTTTEMTTAGATLGTEILPGWGTAIGAAVGFIVGWFASYDWPTSVDKIDLEKLLNKEKDDVLAQLGTAQSFEQADLLFAIRKARDKAYTYYLHADLYESKARAKKSRAFHNARKELHRKLLEMLNQLRDRVWAGKYNPDAKSWIPGVGFVDQNGNPANFNPAGSKLYTVGGNDDDDKPNTAGFGGTMNWILGGLTVAGAVFFITRKRKK